MSNPECNFSPGAARNDDPDTSHIAAQSINVNELELLVLGVIRDSPNGATAQEISDSLGIALNSISPRTAPLVRKGYIIDSGERRKGLSGRPCIVWRAK